MQPTDPVLYEAIKQQVKSSVKRWPSAYASGMLIKLYKDKMRIQNQKPFIDPPTTATRPLKRWFDEKWIDVNTGLACGQVRSIKYYPVCRPSVRVSRATPVTASELPPGAIKRMTVAKQAAGPNVVHYNDTRHR